MTGRLVEAICNFDQVVPELGLSTRQKSPTMVSVVQQQIVDIGSLPLSSAAQSEIVRRNY